MPLACGISLSFEGQLLMDLHQSRNAIDGLKIEDLSSKLQLLEHTDKKYKHNIQYCKYSLFFCGKNDYYCSLLDLPLAFHFPRCSSGAKDDPQYHEHGREQLSRASLSKQPQWRNWAKLFLFTRFESQKVGPPGLKASSGLRRRDVSLQFS